MTTELDQLPETAPDPLPMNSIPPRVPVTHDMTKQGWGHGISIFHDISPEVDGTLYKAVGHSQALVQQGDYIILAGDTEGRTTRYVVDKIDYKRDPRDMFEATLRFYPRYTCSECGAQYDPPMPESCAVCDAAEKKES